jgi:hypothetical protein
LKELTPQAKEMEIFNQKKRKLEGCKAVFRPVKDSWLWERSYSMLPRDQGRE